MKFWAQPSPTLHGKPLVDRMWTANVGGFHFIITQNELGYCATYSDGSVQANGMRTRVIGRCEKFTRAEQMCKDQYKALLKSAN